MHSFFGAFSVHCTCIFGAFSVRFRSFYSAFSVRLRLRKSLETQSATRPGLTPRRKRHRATFIFDAKSQCCCYLIDFQKQFSDSAAYSSVEVVDFEMTRLFFSNKHISAFQLSTQKRTLASSIAEQRRFQPESGLDRVGPPVSKDPPFWFVCTVFSLCMNGNV